MNQALKVNLDEIKAKVKENNLDWVHVNQGGEGHGKSALSLSMASYLDPDFDPEKQVAFDGKEFRKKAKKLDNFKALVYDEGIEGLYSTDHMKKENKKTVKFLRKCRDMNLYIFLNIPVFRELSKKIRRNRVKSMTWTRKQGWAWMYKKSQVKNIARNELERQDYPDPFFRFGWKNPGKSIPDLWSRYKDLKMEDINRLEQEEEQMNDVNWLSTGAVADRLDVSGQTVRDWCGSDKLKFSKLPNGDRRIPEAEVKKLLS